MDLSKSRDCSPHDLLIANLEAHGYENGSLNLLLDYHSFRKKGIKVGSAYSKWSKIRINFSRVNIRPTFVQYIY